MDRRILLSAVGFRPPMVQGIVDYLDPDEVVLIHSDHGESQNAHATLLDQARLDGRLVRSHRVPDWDMLAWSDTIEAVVDKHKHDLVTVNATAGHGLAVTMLAVHAAKRGLPIIVYDWEEEAFTGQRPSDWMDTKIHQHSPGAVLHLRRVSNVDKTVLGALLDAQGTVSELVERTSSAQSSVSTSLTRLRGKGFVEAHPAERGRKYRLVPGIEPMVRNNLRGPST